MYWKWKSRRRKPGRPPIEPKIRNLIRRMSRENPTWGATRIVSELALLGHKVAAWDFFTVPTATFRVLQVFIVLRHDRRQVAHYNVTTHPYVKWTPQQIINAFPYEESPRLLIRDRDDIYGDYFTRRVEGMGIEEVPIAAGFRAFSCPFSRS